MSALGEQDARAGGTYSKKCQRASSRGSVDDLRWTEVGPYAKYPDHDLVSDSGWYFENYLYTWCVYEKVRQKKRD